MSDHPLREELLDVCLAGDLSEAIAGNSSSVAAHDGSGASKKTETTKEEVAPFTFRTHRREEEEEMWKKWQKTKARRAKEGGVSETTPTEKASAVGGKKRAHDDDSSFRPQRLAAARHFMSPTMNPGCDPEMARNMASLAMIASVEECKNCKSKGINPVPSGPMMAKCKCGIYFG